MEREAIYARNVQLRMHNTIQKLLNTPKTNIERRHQLEKTITEYIVAKGVVLTTRLRFMLERVGFSYTF